MNPSLADQLRQFNEMRQQTLRSVEELRHETPQETFARLKREAEYAAEMTANDG